MDSTIVLGAVGFTIAPLTMVGSFTYDSVASASSVAGLSPVVCFMFLMDLDGKISGKLTYQYTKTSYHADGFNITKKNFKETNNKIKYQTPAKEFTVGDYNVEFFNTEQEAEWSREKALGTHTIMANAEMTFLFDLGGGIGLLVWGINAAQLKVAGYAEAKLGGSFTVSYKEGSSWDGIDSSIDGYFGLEAGLLFDASARILAKTGVGDFGLDTDWEHRNKLFDWGISSLGISGTITTPSLIENVPDQGLEGVTVKLTERNTNSAPIITTTNAEGKYSFKNLGADTSYDVELIKDGYVQKRELSSDKQISLGKTSEKKKNFSMSRNLFNKVTGSVEAAGSYKKIASAKITLTNLSNNKVYETYTDANGNYTIGEVNDVKTGVTPAYYRMVISAYDYKPVTKMILISNDTASTISLDSISMVSGYSGDEDCRIEGYVRDFATGQIVDQQLKLYLRRGLNSTTGRIIKTFTLNEDGLFRFYVPAGNYTIEVKDPRFLVSDREKYLTTHFNVTASSNLNTIQQSFYVSRSKSDDQIRIVLTWGNSPSDLDSHLVGPSASGTSKFHTYYSNKTYSYKNKKYDDLDLDDTTSYGPETTTIYKRLLNGTYSFYVHNYTNRDSWYSSALSNSGATVKVYYGQSSKEVATFLVPRNKIGTLWHVFDYDPVRNKLTEKGEIYNRSDPSSIGLLSTSPDTEENYENDLPDDISDNERENLELIFDNLEEKSVDE